ncbi:MAG: GNAT family N-acetyltransferase [Thermoproteota archaeon]|nr:GNAT family N-acetyltransferase [Thermoproteota archaeon]
MSIVRNNLHLLRLTSNPTQIVEWRQIYNQPTPNGSLLLQIKEFLLESSSSYPSIGKWWDTRIVPGLENRERFCQIISVDNHVIALSIGKFDSSSSKLCTLRVHDKYQGLGIGQFLLHKSLSTLTRWGCKNIHYTISEENQSQFGEFFSSYGFSLSTWKKDHYVKGMDELIFSAATDTLIKNHEVSRKKSISQHDVKSMLHQDTQFQLPVFRPVSTCRVLNAENSLFKHQSLKRFEIIR